MKGIADTGFLVAFANRRDRDHDWAVRLAGGISEPLLTCEAVLAEAAFHLQNAAAWFDSACCIPATRSSLSTSRIFAPTGATDAK